MSDMNRSFAGQMPEFYDRFLVPMMFAPFGRAYRAQETVIETIRAAGMSRCPWRA